MDNKYIGMLVNIMEHPPSFEGKVSYWMYRALVMNEALKSRDHQLFFYSFKNVDPETHLAKGYILEGRQFKPLDIEVPLYNYNWSVGGKIASKKRSKFGRKREFLYWVEDQGKFLFPPKIIKGSISDKYACYKMLEKIPGLLQPKTERFAHSAAQLGEFLTKSHRVFIKPRAGSQGENIITLQKDEDGFEVRKYGDKQWDYFVDDSLEHIKDKIDAWIKDEIYIIQEGIEPLKFDTAFTSIRVVMVNNGKEWIFLHEIWVGDKGVEVVNLTQSAYNYPTEQYLLQHLPKKDVNRIINELESVSETICNHLNHMVHPRLIEVSLDLVIDQNYRVHLLELNTIPGFAGTPEDFVDFFNRTPEEEYKYQNYTLKHGAGLTDFLAYHANENPLAKELWFNDVLANTDRKLAPALTDALISSFCARIFDKRADEKSELQLEEDAHPRIIFLSQSDGKHFASVFMGIGNNLYEAFCDVLRYLQPNSRWIAVDIVDEIIEIEKFNKEKPLDKTMSVYGLAFAKFPRMVYLPAQLQQFRLVSSKNTLRLSHFDKMMHNSADKGEAYYFKCQSHFASQSNRYDIFRTHQKFATCTSKELKDSLAAVAQYLKNSFYAQGLCLYEYHVYSNKKDKSLNLGKQLRMLFALLELYAFSKDDDLIEKMKEAYEPLHNMVEELLSSLSGKLQVSAEVKLKNIYLLEFFVRYVKLTKDASFLDKAQQLAKNLGSEIEKSPNIVLKGKWGSFVQILAVTFWGLYELDGNTYWQKLAADLIEKNRQQLKGKNDTGKDVLISTVQCHSILHTISLDKKHIGNVRALSQAMMDKQILTDDNQDWVGGVHSPPKTRATAIMVKELMDAYTFLKAEAPFDEAFLGMLEQTILKGSCYLLRTQIGPEKAMYMANPQQALGGVLEELDGSYVKVSVIVRYIEAIKSVCFSGLV